MLLKLMLLMQSESKLVMIDSETKKIHDDQARIVIALQLRS